MAISQQLRATFRSFYNFSRNVLTESNFNDYHGNSTWNFENFYSEYRIASDLASAIARSGSFCPTVMEKLDDHARAHPDPDILHGDTFSEGNPFGHFWDKVGILDLIRRSSLLYNPEQITKGFDYARQALMSMTARLYRLMLLTFNLKREVRKNLQERGILKIDTITPYAKYLKFGNTDPYSWNFSLNGKREQGYSSVDDELSMELKPLNLKLDKKTFVAGPMEAASRSNEGGWKLNSLVHRISLDQINKIEGEKNQEPIVLEIGVKDEDHAIHTKLLHEADPGSGDEDIVYAERHPDTSTFMRSLDLSHPNSFIQPRDRLN